MNNILNKDFYILPCKEVADICEPFFKKNHLNGFTYSRVFNDGSRSELWSNYKALEHTFLKKRYIADVYTPDFYSNHEKYIYLKFKVENFSDEKLKKKYLNQLYDQKKFFNHDNCFMIVNKTKELCEYFIFYSPPIFTDNINFYLNNTDKLLNFSMVFKEKSKKLIRLSDKNKIIKPWRKTEAFTPPPHFL